MPAGQLKGVDVVEVLVVDDDADIRDTLRLILEDTGYPLAEASNGAEALALLRGARRPRVVLLDLVMPELDGGGVLAAAARDSQLARDHEYIVLTAGTDTLIHTLDPFRSALTLRVVRKPFNVDDVLDAVTEAVQRLDARL